MLVTASIPYSLSIPVDGSGLYTPSGVAYDFAVGALPWLSAATREHPIIRKTAPFRKQQFDSAQEPGEQSLDGWWIKSQQSFHGGCGQLFGDESSGASDFSSIRYWQSKGVDPWTPGEVKLLHRTEVLSGEAVTDIVSDNLRAIGRLDNGDIFTVDDTGTYVDEASPAANPLSVALDSHYYYVATATGVYRRLVTDGPGSPWTALWTITGSPTDVVIGWTKERLVLATTFGIYELVGAGPTLPTPKWTPPQGTWTPTGIAESNVSIYVAGVAVGQRSIILQFSLETSGSMPTLTSGAVVANLPQGEAVSDIFGYLGKYLAISTANGPRIALIGTDGSLDVGPLLFDGTSGNWVASGSFLFTPAVLPEFTEDDAGLARVDLTTDVDTLRFAYSSDLYTAEGDASATGVAIIDGTLYLATANGIFVEQSTYVDEGYLQTSRQRFGTLEPKLYEALRVRGPILESDFFVSVVDPNGTEYTVVGYVAGQTPGETDVSIQDLGPLDYLSVKFTLSSTADNLSSAIASGYQLKVLPGQPHRRLIILPVWCFDWELDHTGQQVGAAGSASTRLAAMEALDSAADIVNFQDFNRDTVERVAIDSVEFVQTSPPTGPQGWGGIITLTLRTVE